MVIRFLLGYFFMCLVKIELFSFLSRVGDIVMFRINMVFVCRVVFW